jgi:hypothetical protein
MIDLNDIYARLGRMFVEMQPTFHFGDNAIIHGTLADLPEPDVIASTFTDGDYFALINIEAVIPHPAGNKELVDPEYGVYITLCRKGKGNIDVTRIRNDMVNVLCDAWSNFWTTQQGYRQEIRNIQLAVHELEEKRNIIAIQLTGVIQHITQWSQRRSRLDG